MAQTNTTQDYTADIETQFRLLQTVEEYNPQYFDPDYGTGPYWDDTLYYNRNCHSDMTTIHQQTTRMIWRLKTTIEFQPKKEESLS